MLGGELPPLFDMTPERRDEMIEKLAQRITKAGMGSPALIFLEMNKPLGRITGNTLHLFSPFLGVVIPNIDQYGYLLQDPVNLEMLIDRIQEIEEERGRQQKALREERKARARERKLRARGLLPPGAEAGETPPAAGDETGGKDES